MIQVCHQRLSKVKGILPDLVYTYTLKIFQILNLCIPSKKHISPKELIWNNFISMEWEQLSQKGDN